MSQKVERCFSPFKAGPFLLHRIGSVCRDRSPSMDSNVVETVREFDTFR